MTIRKVVLMCVMVVAVAIPLTALGSPADDYPSKSLEFVSQTPGASMDNLGRLIISIIQQEKLLSQPIAVNNKGGGGGAVQMAYMLSKKGSPYHFFGTSTNLLLGTPMLEKLPYSCKDFVPIVNLSLDGSLLYVRADSPFRTVKDLIAEAKKKPKTLRMATSTVTSGESMTGKALQRSQGAEWNIAYFNGDPEVATNVLGGHVEFAIGNPNFVFDHIRAGKIRALMAVAPKRYTQGPLKDVPTIGELGMGEPLVARRAFLGPPEMPDYAVNKLVAVFKKVSEHPTWSKFLDDNMQQSAWMDAQALGAWISSEAPKHRQRLVDVGLIK